MRFWFVATRCIVLIETNVLDLNHIWLKYLAAGLAHIKALSEAERNDFTEPNPHKYFVHQIQFN